MGTEAWEMRKPDVRRADRKGRGVSQLYMNILVNWLNPCDPFFRSSQKEEKRDEQW